MTVHTVQSTVRETVRSGYLDPDGAPGRGDQLRRCRLVPEHVDPLG